MMHKKLSMSLVVLMAAVAMVATGCASKKSRNAGSSGDTVSSSSDSASSSGADSASARGVGGADANGEGVAGPQSGLLAQRIIYFDFDRSDIRPDFVELIAAHGRYVASHPNVRLRLEGHSDERGSREYNIGLGERRAQAVRRALSLQGVGEGQVATVSYGEERPAVAESNEEAWAKNRRVEIVYLTQ